MREDSLDLDDTILSQNPRHTLQAKGWDVRPLAPASLSQVRVLEAPEQGPAEIVLGRELGRGGMGVVRTALQAPLGREVAVKLLKSGASEAQRCALAKEALINGALEHPNITPVHLLAKDEQGRPLLVMKQVQGVVWEKMLSQPEHEAWAQVIGDRLEWNLSVLLQVAHAVSFAHSRGILHRDIKPENVMIGAYGEVYLLDWGVAIALEEAEHARELVRKLKIAGTPAYMPPEMIDADRGPIGPHTDVFMLGGILHRILTGAPPNLAENLAQTLTKALKRTEVSYPASVPAQLAQIATRALASEPLERFGSAEAFRRALIEHVQSRGALRLCAQAGLKLQRLEKSPDAQSPVELYRLFGECRFGFTEAMQLQPNLAPAKEGIARALKRMIEFELNRKNAEGAELHLEELYALGREDEGALKERLAQLKAESSKAQAELARLQRLEQDMDVDVGARRRSIAILAFAAFIVGMVSLVVEMAEVLRPLLPGPPSLYTRSLLVGGLSLVGVVGRRTLLANTATRRLSFGLLMTLLASFCNLLLGLMLDTPIDEIFIIDQLIGAAGLSVMAVTIDKKLAPAALVLVLGAFISAQAPHRTAGVAAAAVIAAVGCMVIAWRFGARDRAPPQSPPERSSSDSGSRA